MAAGYDMGATPGKVPVLAFGPKHDKPQKEGVKLQVINELCVGCSYCLMSCDYEALIVESMCEVLLDKCTDCLRCLMWCPTGALVYE
jgi:Na+-translocating ferredoxin:NAD+ oxidoreductase RNF subunit RnfB